MATCSQGAFATVYQARHRFRGEVCAVKLLNSELAMKPSALRRFEREAMLAVELDHPDIVEVIETGQLSDGRPFFALEWIHEGNLEEELYRRGPLPLREAISLLELIGAPLCAAHAQGVVHRDLKPSNILILDRELSRIKLTDFGIAKDLTKASVAANSQQTTTGVHLGTPAYMAPEQILGQPVDQRTDIYALGVLLFRLVAGREPFRADSRLELEAMHVSASPPPLAELAGVNSDVDAVVSRCLSKDPKQRYSTVDDMLAALTRATTRATSAPEPPQKKVGIGIFIEFHLESSDDDSPSNASELLDLERCVEIARSRFEQMELALVLDSTSTLLAVDALPFDSEANRHRRVALIKATCQLAEQLRDRSNAHQRCLFSISIDVSSVVEQAYESNPSVIVDGKILQASQWSIRRPGHVSISVAALSGCEQELAPDRAVLVLDSEIS